MTNKKENSMELLKKNKQITLILIFLTIVILAGFILLKTITVTAVPTGVSNLNVIANETATSGLGTLLNISGGYIATINFTASTQNPRWKGFVGNVSGSFTLDDAAGSTIYDWSIASVTGEVYATRNASTLAWSTIQCANTTLMENENNRLFHSSPEDNISATFAGTTHSEFFVGSVNITVNRCPTLNTYVNSAAQDSTFEEIIITDSTVANLTAGNLIYVTIMEQDSTGFDGLTYDFQMIVPEEGDQGNTAVTAYYLYAELN